MSRLPHCAVASTLSQRRPNLDRSASVDSAGLSSSRNEVGIEQTPEVEEPDHRHKSLKARLSGGVQPPKSAETHRLRNVVEEPRRGRSPAVREPQMYGMRQEQSPTGLDNRHPSIMMEGTSPPHDSANAKNGSLRQRRNTGRRPAELNNSRGFDFRGLAPPRSPYAQRTPSPNSVSNDSPDEDLMGGSFLSQQRKLSSSSAFSSSPASPYMRPCAPARSPSVSSEMSVGGTRSFRPTLNFSRPISRASGPPSIGIPSRQTSSDSQTSVYADDQVHTPISMHSAESLEDPLTASPSQAYIYSTFQLPRGKTPHRNSLLFQGPHPQGQQKLSQSGNAPEAPSSPPQRPSTSSEVIRPSNERIRPSMDHRRPSHDTRRAPTDPSQQDPPTLHPKSRGTSSINSGSTIKARSLAPSSSEASAEDHVSKAIEYHEQGELTKSTYHLRLAARQNHPTGMLLYALACRHGWGMRRNQKDGVMWLRKAVESAQLEIGEEDPLKDKKPVDTPEKKAEKARFALGIYELGVSHMNGWGTEQDKALALKCYEIAGNWGDGDALAEAGFCYAEGQGCKKDMKKAARLYRLAEKKGISMVGNSWIYKDKYQDDEEERPNTSSSHRRSKSKSRTIFGRKKSHQ